MINKSRALRPAMKIRHKKLPSASLSRQERTKDYIKARDTYAVIGASSSPEKYGYKVLKNLLDNGYTAIPINPKAKSILGQKAYATISDVKEKIDVAIFVVPPAVTEKILKTIKNYNINKVWLQPGSESDAAVKFCRANNIECVHNACIILKNK